MSSKTTEQKIARRVQDEAGCAYMTALNAVRAKLSALIDDGLDYGGACRRARELGAAEFGLTVKAAES